MIHGKRSQCRKRYREFVETGLAEEDEDFKASLKESPRSIGSDGFRAWVDELYQKLIEKHSRPEDISFRRITEPLKPEEVLKVLSEELDVDGEEFKQRRRDSMLRAMAGRYLCRYAGFTQRDVAEILEAGSGSAISRQMRKLPEVLPKKRNLKRKIGKIENRLEEIKKKRRVIPE